MKLRVICPKRVENTSISLSNAVRKHVSFFPNTLIFAIAPKSNSEAEGYWEKMPNK